jgi:hypothetical protein
MSQRIHCSYDPRIPEVWTLSAHYVRSGVVVPIGFRWDGASSPKFARSIFPRWGDYSGAALVHDYMYSKECLEIKSRNKADLIFLNNMKEDGVSYIRRHMMYYAVRLFGNKYFKIR